MKADARLTVAALYPVVETALLKGAIAACGPSVIDADFPPPPDWMTRVVVDAIRAHLGADDANND